MSKSLLLSIVLIVFGLNCKAADEFVDGIIITNHLDTVHCKILVPKDFGKFNEPELLLKCTALDSLGKKIKYKPNDIMGYEFVYQSKRYRQYSIQTEDDGKRMFVWKRNSGKRVNEYYYYSFNTSDHAKGAMGNLYEVYVLEDADTKETVVLTKGGAWGVNYRSQLKNFFQNDKKVLKVMVKDVKDFHDIDKFVVDTNSEY